jgi:hypothetical protein
MGNVDDVYDLSVSGAVGNAGIYEEWEATLDNVSLFVPRGESRITVLHVTAPENAKTRTWNTLTITVTSRMQPPVTDNDTAIAYVLQLEPRTFQTGIKISVEAAVIAIDVWPPIWDFGVIAEAEIRQTSKPFTIRNVGNVPVNVSIYSVDAVSRPGELVTKWVPSDTGVIGVDLYTMWYKTVGWNVLSKTPSLVADNLPPGGQSKFDLKIQAPRVITVPAKMWAVIRLVAMNA